MAVNNQHCTYETTYENIHHLLKSTRFEVKYFLGFITKKEEIYDEYVVGKEIKRKMVHKSTSAKCQP